MIWVGLIMNKWACFGGEGPHAQNDGGLPFLFFPQVHQVEGWCNAIHHHGDHRSLPTLFRFTQFVLAISGCYADFACRHVRNWKEEVRNHSRLKEQGGSWAVWQGGGEAAGEKGCFLKCFGFYQKKKKNLKKTPKKNKETNLCVFKNISLKAYCHFHCINKLSVSRAFPNFWLDVWAKSSLKVVWDVHRQQVLVSLSACVRGYK